MPSKKLSISIANNAASGSIAFVGIPRRLALFFAFEPPGFDGVAQVVVL